MKLFYDCFTQHFSRLEGQFNLELSTNISKLYQMPIGKVQKVNENNEPLFNKDIFDITETQIKIGETETIEVTDRPLIKKVHKVDDCGKKLFIDYILDENGEVVDSYETTDNTDISGNKLEPVLIDMHVTSTNGKLIYIKDVFETKVEKTYIETIETTEVTDKPIMIDGYQEMNVNIFDNPELFNMSEVIDVYTSEQAVILQWGKGTIDFFTDTNLINEENSVYRLSPGGIILDHSNEIILKPINVISGETIMIELDGGHSELIGDFIKIDNNLYIANSDTLNLKIKNYVIQPSIVRSIKVFSSKIKDNESEVNSLKGQVEELSLVVEELILGGN